MMIIINCEHLLLVALACANTRPSCNDTRLNKIASLIFDIILLGVFVFNMVRCVDEGILFKVAVIVQLSLNVLRSYESLTGKRAD